MSAQSQPTLISLWSGRITSVLGIIFLLVDGIGHVLDLAPVKAASAQIGFPDSRIQLVGVIQLVCLALYIFPRTALLGAVLLTGYLGGAIAVNMRAGASLSTLIFPLFIGALVWIPLYLRNQKLRELLLEK